MVRTDLIDHNTTISVNDHLLMPQGIYILTVKYTDMLGRVHLRDGMSVYCIAKRDLYGGVLIRSPVLVYRTLLTKHGDIVNSLFARLQHGNIVYVSNLGDVIAKDIVCQMCK